MSESWTPKPADRVVRHPREDDIQPIRLTINPRRVPSKFAATPLLMVYTFLGFITIGTLLLLLPFTHHGSGFTPIMTAVFTSTSAITVTGLVVEDTAFYWTRIGQVIILGLIYVGGLGFMTTATFMMILIGQRVTLAQRLVVRESLMINQLGGMVRLTVGIVIVATLIQVVGFGVLFSKFYFAYPLPEAVWQAAFHSVSSFNGAGFVVFKEVDQLIIFRTDPIILGAMAALIFTGALSYLVIIDLVRLRKFSLFTLNTKLVLTMTLGLSVVAIVGFLLAEWGNVNTLGPLSITDKLTASIFQGISLRTAGFTIVELDYAYAHSNFLTSAIMFIGGASATVAGGLKVNTLAIILLGVIALIRGRHNVTAFGRELPASLVQRAMVLGAVSMTFMFLVVFLLTISESKASFETILFEAASAFGTVGLSLGLTPNLSVFGEWIIIVTMFIGKLGPLTIGLTMLQRTEHDLYRYPQERVTIG